MRVRILGAVQVFADGVELALPAGKPRALLAMLALAGGRPVPPDALVVGIWGEDAPEAPVKTLQVHISTLRSRLREADMQIDFSPAGYALAVAPDEIDVVCFERLAEEGLSALAEQAPDVASRALQRALELWTGEPLSNVLEAPFAAHEAERLALRRLAVAEARIDADLALGLGAGLVDEARALCEANPYDERACGQLMLALYRAGQPVAALEAYRRLRRTLGDELGLTPGPALVQLERQILTHDDALLVRRTATASKRPSLPQQVSSFIGRERELTELRTAISAARLVTLTGAGGAGKTRLALAVGESMADEFPDGVWLVELAPLQVADNVVTTTAQALATRHDNGVDGIAEGIGDRTMVVLLDNCEHVIDAAAKLAEGLLRHCPHLRVLATSREPLAIDGEHVYRVPSLALPPDDVADAEAAMGSDAVRLFLDRARLHRGDFQLNESNVSSVIQICARLDGMPLAIELAAARLRMFSVEAMADRVDQRFRLLAGPHRGGHARQQTLRTLIDWSYDLLTPTEQLMLERVSVFAGGFTMEAVEAIASTQPGIDELDVVTALVDKSLVEVELNESGRLRLLETIREYAAERFQYRDPSVVDATRTAHARYYLATAEKANQAVDQGGQQLHWLNRLTVEHENLRVAAQTFHHAPADAEDGLRLVHSLRNFWDIRGLYEEGAATAARFLEHAEAPTTSGAYVLALCTACDMCDFLGEFERAEEYADRAAALARIVGEPGLEANAALRCSGMAARRGDGHLALELLAPYSSTDSQYVDQGRLHSTRAFAFLGLNDLVACRAALEKAASASRGDERRLAKVLTNLSCIDLAEGNLEAATSHLTEAQVLAARLQDVPNLGFVALNLGIAAVAAGNYQEASVRFREALLMFWPGGDRVGIYGGILGSALCCSAAGECGLATELHGFLDVALENEEYFFDPTESRLRNDDRSRLHEIQGRHEFENRLRQGRTLTLAEAVATAKDAATRFPHPVPVRPDENT